ncbi:peptide synthetase, partial [Advenella kashmirensis W13003]
MNSNARHLAPEQIRDQIRALLTEPDAAFSDDDNLIELGMDSLGLMKLVGQWRKAGKNVSFAELIETPRLADWWPALAGAPGADDTVTPASPDPFDVTAPFPLTDVQHAYWIGRNDEQILGGVGCHAYLELSGRDIDPQRLEKAWERLLAHHGMLRARFDSLGAQVIATEAPAEVRRVFIQDLRQHTPASVREQLLSLRQRLSHRRLSVERGEVAGLSLSLLPDNMTRLHFDVDLLVADVQSLQIILHDLAVLYELDETPRAPLEWHFGRHLHNRKHSQTSAQNEAQKYWQARLATLPGPPGLPLRCAPETIEHPRFTRRQHHMPAHEWSRIKRFCAAARVTPAMVLASAYAETLAAWSGTSNFLLNLPLFDRHGDTAGLDHVVADFTNLLLLAVDCSQAMSFADRVRALQTQFHADAAHSDWSGVRVQRDLAQMRDGERTFAPVVFACNLGMPLVDQQTQEALGQLHYMISQTPQVWLDHQVYDKDGGVLLAWDAVDDLFPDGMIESMFGAYLHLLTQLANSEQAWAEPLIVQLPAGQRAVREEVNATDAPLTPRTLHLPVFEQARTRPAHPALIDSATGQTLDYAALNRRALQVCTLLQQHGVQPGEPVAITLPRGIDQVVAVLGVLAAGACYVPIGIAQPAARQQRIHRRAGIQLVLTQPLVMTACEAEIEATMVDIGNATAFAPAQALTPVPPSALAYIIFTSGSTGEPKGVEISHQAAANTLDDLNQRFCVEPDDRILALSALDFDLSVYDLFGLLGAGATVVLPAEEERRDAAAWLDLVHRHHITLWNSVPVLLDMLLIAAEGDTRPLPLRLAMASGDWIGLDLPGRLVQLAPQARFIAMGGATEAAIWSNLCEVPVPVPSEWRSIPYGTPLANQQYRVVDALGRDCPDWVPGELWIGGAGVANGYRGDPQRTAAAFVTYNNQRWYRTGDLGRYWPDGTLEFLGRRDHQIKLRGHRIELGEIEAAILTCNGLRQAVAMVVGQPPALAAAFVANRPLQHDALNTQLRRLLPDYMVPTHWLQLDSLPLSANGKIDRKTLADQLDLLTATHTETTSSGNHAPSGSAEQQVAAIWQKRLGRSSLNRDDHFFQLGGDSLLATQVVADMQRDGWQAQQPLRRLFSHPVLSDFAAIWQQGDATSQKAATFQHVSDNQHDPFELTEIQRAYWMGQSDGLPLHCGTLYMLELDGAALDLARLDTAWRRLWQRHPMLRACVDENARQYVPGTLPESRLQIEAPVADLHAARERIGLHWRSLSRSHATPALHSFIAVPYCGDRCRLGLFFDYLTLDGYSIKLLLADLIKLYDNVVLPDPPQLTFRDYLTQRTQNTEAYEAAIHFWQERLTTLPPAPSLPLAREPGSLGQASFYRLYRRMPAGQWQRIRDTAQRFGLTPSVVLLAAYAHVLSQWSTDSALTLNLTLFERPDAHPDIARVLGDFTALAPIPFEPASQTSLLALGGQTQDRVAEVLEHRAVSSIWVQRERARSIGLQAAALPIVFTSTLGLADQFFDTLPQGFPDLVDGGLSETPQVWLDYQVFEHRGELVMSWDIAEGLFPEGMIESMFDAYLHLLTQLAGNEQAWTDPLPALVPHEQQAVRKEVNATDTPLASRTLHLPVFEQARTRPAHPALIDSATGQTLDYAALARRALQVCALLQQHGVQPGEPVAITLPRGIDQVVAVLGVLAAGACYVPIGIAQPAARQQRIHRRAGIRLVLTHSSAASEAKVDTATPAATESETETMLLDIGDAVSLAPVSAPVSVSPSALAYIIFTSGSTGEPKGVEISHQAA